jgi:hypothetical protein
MVGIFSIAHFAGMEYLRNSGCSPAPGTAGVLTIAGDNAQLRGWEGFSPVDSETQVLNGEWQRSHQYEKIDFFTLSGYREICCNQS